MLFTFITIFLHFTEASAHQPEKGAVWASAGPVVNRTVESMGTGEAESFLGAGIVSEGDLSKHGGLELGIFYLERQYSRRSAGRTLVERVNRVHIPFGYRHWLNEKFSAGLAFYSSYRMGDAEEVSRSPSLPNDFHTSAEEKLTEYGFDFSVQYEPWRREKYGVTIDARYSLPINEQVNESADHISVLIGIKHLIEQK